MNGLLVIDKPGGMTSRDVVNRVQRWFPRKSKIGHTGTLDPLATGVLVVCVGAATRLADFVQAMGKTYRSRFLLGATSDTDDADGRVTPTPNPVHPTLEQIDTALVGFIGDIEQVPPAVSALKVEGRRAHDLARKAKEVKLAARTVRIDAIRVLGYEWPHLDVEIDCGKGTYIRSIARDLGDMLDCGGMVETLRRTQVGPFTADDGIGLDVTPEEAKSKLLPMATAVSHLPRVYLDQAAARRFFHGQVVTIPQRPGGKPQLLPVAVMAPGMQLFAIGLDNTAGMLRPDIVFANPDS